MRGDNGMGYELPSDRMNPDTEDVTLSRFIKLSLMKVCRYLVLFFNRLLEVYNGLSGCR